MKVIYVNCPTCRTTVEYSEKSEFRPFCSERCKIQDTAAWASEEYKLPSKEPISDSDIEDAIEHHWYKSNQ